MNICFHGPWYSRNCKGNRTSRLYDEKAYRDEYIALRNKLVFEMREEGHILLAREIQRESLRGYDILKDEICTVEGGWNTENMNFGSKANNGYYGIVSV